MVELEGVRREDADDREQDEQNQPRADEGCGKSSAGVAGRTRVWTRGEEVQSEDDDGGHPLGLVYDAVKNGQSPYELERDGWYTGEIHEAVGTWYEMLVFVRSQENGLSPAPGSGMQRLPRSIACCLHDAVGGVMEVLRRRRSEPSGGGALH